MRRTIVLSGNCRNTGLFTAAKGSSNSVHRRKAVDEMKELANKTGLEMMKNAALLLSNSA